MPLSPVCVALFYSLIYTRLHTNSATISSPSSSLVR